MRSGRHCKNVLKRRKSKAGVRAGQGSSGKAGEVNVAAPVISGAVRSKAGSAYQVLEVAKKEYWFVRERAFNELEELYEVESGSALSGKINAVLADPPHSSRSARG